MTEQTQPDKLSALIAAAVKADAELDAANDAWSAANAMFLVVGEVSTLEIQERLWRNASKGERRAYRKALTRLGRARKASQAALADLKAYARANP